MKKATDGPTSRRLVTTAKEQPEQVKTKIQGVIPAWINGSLVRVGPGMFELGGRQLNHWFDGLGLLHRFNIENGQVTYHSKYLRTEAYKQGTASQRLVFSEFGTARFPDPCKNIFARFFSQLLPTTLTDNDIICVYQCGDELYAATETPHITRFDLKTLDTTGRVDISKHVNVNLALAHTHSDPDGTVYTVGTSFTMGPSYKFVSIPPVQGNHPIPKAIKNAKVVSSINGQFWLFNTYFHSFGMSENYFILFELPYAVNVFKLLMGDARGKALSDCFEWYPNLPTKIRIVNRKTGQEVKHVQYAAEPMFVFHHINAYEEDDHLVIDVIKYNDPEIIRTLYLNNLSKDGPISPMKSLPIPVRYALPLHVKADDHKVGETLLTLPCGSSAVLTDRSTIHCLPGNLTNEPMELPIINYAYNAKKYQFFYACSSAITGSTGTSAIFKIDVTSGEKVSWVGEAHQIPGEPIFVPSPNAMSEDEGVILSGVVCLEEGCPSFLLVLDAKTFTEIGRAQIPSSVDLPIVLHGKFVSKD